MVVTIIQANERVNFQIHSDKVVEIMHTLGQVRAGPEGTHMIDVFFFNYICIVQT